MEREVMWISLDSQVFEHVLLFNHNNSILADGIIIHLEKNSSYRIRYNIECDSFWRVRKVELNMLDNSNRNLLMFSDGEGNWTNQNGEIIAELNGCIDVDIYYSPFTNTVAIKRLNLKLNESGEIITAYINTPELTAVPDPQRYTFLEQSPELSKYLYESIDSDFKAELSVDSDMLLIEYPQFFRRHWAR